MSAEQGRAQWLIVAALGTAQTLAWASSYYLPAIVAGPMAASLGVPQAWVFGAFSGALLLSAALGPWAGGAIDRLGGRLVLTASSLVFAAGLVLLAVAPSFALLCLGWAALGVGMAIGLYDAAFATLSGLYGRAARGPITGITLIAGFASTVGWPLSTVLLNAHSWRAACLAWAAMHLVVGLPLNRLVVPHEPQAADEPLAVGAAVGDRRSMALLAFAFAATWVVSTAMAAHLPALLRAAGASATAAVAAASLVGPAQVAARVAEFALLRRTHPMVSARIATMLHPLGALLLAVAGGPASAGFAVLHGAGNGMLTIAKGTLPLALFGPAGYGLRTGLLSAPSRVAQATAPLGFAWALDAWGAGALWLTAAMSMASVAALLALRISPRVACGGVQ
jgi:predicted MFS family arabinose efflux permease